MEKGRSRKRTCKLCELAIKKSRDEKLILYKGWLKDPSKFTISKEVCDGCIAKWSEKTGFPAEFHDQIGFWLNWHDTNLNRIKMEVKTEEQVDSFNDYWDNKKIHARRFLKKLAGNPNKMVSIGKTYQSYMRFKILGTPLEKIEVQEETRKDIATLVKETSKRLSEEMAIPKLRR